MTSPNELLPPRYRNPIRIGYGGMGEIFRAEDEVLERTVAVKVLAERYARDDSLRSRFTREAQAAARLSAEPNTVTIFDVGEWHDRPFIVMEHLDGGSLEDRLREGPPSQDEALGWLDQAAAALDAAHRHGVVHRDVKPGNLLLDQDDSLRVADFGIASAAGLASLTMTGTVLGTAGYLSPEQAQGERATPASDRYALGVVAYELLTGRRPFESDSPTAEAAAHVNAEVPPVSPRLDPIFQRALAKDPRDRYETASELVAALREAVEGGSATTRVLPVAHRSRVPVVAACRRRGSARWRGARCVAHPRRRRRERPAGDIGADDSAPGAAAASTSSTTAATASPATTATGRERRGSDRPGGADAPAARLRGSRTACAAGCGGSPGQRPDCTRRMRSTTSAPRSSGSSVATRRSSISTGPRSSRVSGGRSAVRGGRAERRDGDDDDD